jgi:L-lactate utilization protein LutC
MDRQKLFAALSSRKIEPFWFETGEEAAAFLASRLQGQKIVFGGSQTLKEIGLYDALSKDNEVFWHWVTKDLVARRQAEVAASVYVASANAISETGEIINMDGSCNRVANLAYGHEQVIYVAGVNKVVPTLEEAVSKVRNVTGPLNSKRGNAKTPCVASDETKCFDCRSDDRSCRVMTITMFRPRPVKLMQLILINQNLGL